MPREEPTLDCDFDLLPADLLKLNVPKSFTTQILARRAMFDGKPSDLLLDRRFLKSTGFVAARSNHARAEYLPGL
jgi:hypothetical protein